MRSTFLFLIFLITHVSASIAQSTLPATALHPVGRYGLANNELELIGSAVHVGWQFTGTECAVYVNIKDPGAHGYLQYVLDGVYQKRLRVEGNNHAPLIIKVAKGGSHTLWLFKATEAITGPLFLEKITGTGLHALQESPAPLIEFIGNSITCGAAADPSETPCGTGVYHDQHNAYYAYGPRVARALKTNFIISAVSGIGIYRNWNSDGPTMPQVYEKTDLQPNSGRAWDYKAYTPRIISIALGTNDYSHGDGRKARLPFDSAAFVNHYIDFVKLVKTQHPSAQIALLSSPMLNGADRAQLQNCLTAVKQQIDKQVPSGKRVAVFFFQPMQPRGCGYHPSVEDHGIMADQLIPFFKKLL